MCAGGVPVEAVLYLVVVWVGCGGGVGAGLVCLEGGGSCWCAWYIRRIITTRVQSVGFEAEVVDRVGCPGLSVVS